MIKVKKQKLPRIKQGDIIRNVEYIEYYLEELGSIEISSIVFPLVIVLTQDCDLEQDYHYRWSKNRPKNNDKFLLSVLVAPIYNAEHVYSGEHLSEIGLSMQTINKGKTQGNNIRNNQTPRYHYLEFSDEIPITPSIIDFKHYFSVNIQYLKRLKKTNFICSISELYREDISQRFSAFLSRIGLPSR